MSLISVYQFWGSVHVPVSVRSDAVCTGGCERSEMGPAFCCRDNALPDFNSHGDLPPGVHKAHWPELRRVFPWGSFVSSKVSPGDIDVLLIPFGDV